MVATMHGRATEQQKSAVQKAILEIAAKGIEPTAARVQALSKIRREVVLAVLGEWRQTRVDRSAEADKVSAELREPKDHQKEMVKDNAEYAAQLRDEIVDLKEQVFELTNQIIRQQLVSPPPDFEGSNTSAIAGADEVS